MDVEQAEQIVFTPKLLGYTRRLARSIVNTDDAESDGMLALVKAVDSFDPERGVKFATYLSLRIRGEVIDGLRTRGHVSRNDRRKIQEGRVEPTAAWQQPVSLEALYPEDHAPYDHPDPGYDVEKILIERAIAKRVEALWRYVEMTATDARTLQIMRWRFVDHETLLEIGDRLGMTESRVSQIIKRELARIRSGLGVAK